MSARCLVPWDHLQIHGMVSPFRVLTEAQNTARLVEIHLLDWNGSPATWRMRISALEGDDSDFRVRGEFTSATTLGDAPEWFTVQNLAYIKAVDDETEHTSPLVPELADSGLELPEQVDLAYAEVKLTGALRGIADGEPYYSALGGVVTLDDVWLSAEGRFSGRELSALLGRMAEVMNEQSEFRIAPATGVASLPMRLSVGPRGISIADGEPVRLAGADGPLPHEA